MSDARDQRLTQARLHPVSLCLVERRPSFSHSRVCGQSWVRGTGRALINEADTALAGASRTLPGGLTATDRVLKDLQPVVAQLNTRKQKLAELAEQSSNGALRPVTTTLVN